LDLPTSREDLASLWSESTAMDNLDFLCISDRGNASLTIFSPPHQNHTINGLDLDIIAASCPLLAACFEDRWTGPHHSLEASSGALIISFLRFLYTGSYTTVDANGEAVPCSLLLHAELCHLGDLFEAPALMVQAHCNILLDTEFACSQSSPPRDLCQAIRFIYEHLSAQRELIDTVLHYCVSCFLYHGLAKDEEFRKVAYEVRAFHNDLCRCNFRRGFEDDGAIDIIRLPVRDATECIMVKEQQEALGDFLYELWGDVATPFETPNLGPTPLSPEPSYALVHRPRNPTDHARVEDSDGFVSDGSSSDVEGFSLVHRPQVNGKAKAVGMRAVETRAVEAKAVAPRDIFDDIETGWLGIDEPLRKNSGMYLQKGLADSTATIRPLIQKPASVSRSDADDFYSSDSDSWSVVDKREATPASFLGGFLPRGG
jgi:hypothetical protein